MKVKVLEVKGMNEGNKEGKEQKREERKEGKRSKKGQERDTKTVLVLRSFDIVTVGKLAVKTTSPVWAAK
jgi:hypothetical protein